MSGLLSPSGNPRALNLLSLYLRSHVTFPVRLVRCYLTEAKVTCFCVCSLFFFPFSLGMPEVMNSEILLLLSDHANKFCFGIRVLSNYFVIRPIFPLKHQTSCTKRPLSSSYSRFIKPAENSADCPFGFVWEGAMIVIACESRDTAVEEWQNCLLLGCCLPP